MCMKIDIYYYINCVYDRGFFHNLSSAVLTYFLRRGLGLDNLRLPILALILSLAECSASCAALSPFKAIAILEAKK